MNGKIQNDLLELIVLHLYIAIVLWGREGRFLSSLLMSSWARALAAGLA